jgi:hypothetical protein
MSKRPFRIPGGQRPLLDIASYGRWGPGGTVHLSPAQIADIHRTVHRVPEVMVKVLSKDSNNLRSVGRHLNYIGRYGELEIEADECERIQGRDAGQQLLEDWDLDLDKDRKETGLASVAGRSPKLVHKIILSMPPGTPAEGVLEAARNFARQEFALKHRYAFVLHTDEPHPHVHLVVKAVSEQGARLNIRKETLREWRREFARHLRDQGIAANATERAVRGETRIRPIDAVYRAQLRGDSTRTRARVEAVVSELPNGSMRTEEGKSMLVETRRNVVQGWRTMSDLLLSQGQPKLAAEISRFIDQMRPPRTEREQIAAELVRRAREPHVREVPRTR